MCMILFLPPFSPRLPCSFCSGDRTLHLKDSAAEVRDAFVALAALGCEQESSCFQDEGRESSAPCSQPPRLTLEAWSDHKTPAAQRECAAWFRRCAGQLCAHGGGVAPVSCSALSAFVLSKFPMFSCILYSCYRLKFKKKKP